MKTRLNATVSGLVLLTIVLAATQPTMATDLFVCRKPGEPPLYSQFPCAAPQSALGPSAGAQESLTLGAVQLVEIPALSDAELRRLAKAEHEAASERRSLRAARLRSLSERLRHETRQRQDCSKAKRQLEALAARKRKGYALREARRLDDQERRLQQAVQANC